MPPVTEEATHEQNLLELQNQKEIMCRIDELLAAKEAAILADARLELARWEVLVTSTRLETAKEKYLAIMKKTQH